MSFAQDRSDLLAHYSPAVVSIAEALSSAILSTGLNFEQTISLRLRIHYFKHNGVVAAISLHKAHVNLHFYKGRRLNAPPGVLQGNGKMLRHLRFSELHENDLELVKDLVRQAHALNEN